MEIEYLQCTSKHLGREGLGISLRHDRCSIIEAFEVVPKLPTSVLTFHLHPSNMSSAPPTPSLKTPRPTWQPLSPKDIPSLLLLAARIHPSLPESGAVFAERVRLFPSGCLALFSSISSSSSSSSSPELLGYAISHPIRCRQPPSLDTFLGEIAPDADQYYIHDLAILPELRGKGLAKECLDLLLGVAKGYVTTSLVSVYGTGAFWGRFGFAEVDVEEALGEKVRGYGEDAVFLERRNEGVDA